MTRAEFAGSVVLDSTTPTRKTEVNHTLAELMENITNLNDDFVWTFGADAKSTLNFVRVEDDDSCQRLATLRMEEEKGGQTIYSVFLPHREGKVCFLNLRLAKSYSESYASKYDEYL